MACCHLYVSAISAISAFNCYSNIGSTAAPFLRESVSSKSKLQLQEGSVGSKIVI
jgi:hypothetical protein